MRPPARIQVVDEKTMRALESSRGAVIDIASRPIIAGRLIEGVELANAVTRKINHGLGRKIRGWIIADTVGATATGRIQRVTGADLDLQLWLQANGHGATITVSLWAF